MDTKLCELCHAPGKLICFCRKAILCDLCIGRHFLTEPSLSHKPINLAQTEIARVYEEHLHQLHESEERLLGEVQLRQTLARLSKERLIAGLQKIDETEQAIRAVIGTLRETVTKQVEEFAERMTEEFVAKCEKQRELLQSALSHFSGSQLCPDNPIVLILKEMRSAEEVKSIEVFKYRLEARVVDVTEDMKRAIVFSLESLQRRPEPARTPVPDGKAIAKTAPGKKPLAKPAPPVISKSKAQSLNTSAVAPTAPEAGLDAAKLAKRLGTLKQTKGSSPPRSSRGKKDLIAERRKTVFEVGHFLSVPDVKASEVKSDEDGNAAGDSEEDAIPIKKYGTEIPGVRTSPAAKITTLQSARTKNRQTLMQETAKKVEDIVEQVRGLKTSPRMNSHTARASLLPEQQSDPEKGVQLDVESAAKLTSAADSERSGRMSMKSGEPPTSLTPTQQLNLTITRASEVSKVLIAKTELKELSPRGSVAASDPFLHTYEVLSGSTQIRILSLEENNSSVRSVVLRDDEVFGEEIAWCLDPTGRVYFFGGRDSGGSAVKNIYEYDPVTGESETGYVMLAGRYRHTATFFAEGIFLIGGAATSRCALKDCERFDPVRKLTKRIGALSVPREGHGACLFASTLYVAGGSVRSDTVEKLSQDGDAFQQIRVSESIGASATLIATKDRVVILHRDAVSHLDADGVMRTAGAVAEKDWWSAGQPVVLSRCAYVRLGDGMYRLDIDRSQVEKIEGS